MPLERKSFENPDEHIVFPGGVEDLVEVGDHTVGRVVTEPGWRWSTHLKPVVGGEWCQARHVGIVLSGRMGIDLVDGSNMEFEAGDVYDMPPGHDGYTIGDEPAVVLEWSGLRTFSGPLAGFRTRTLATLLFTDLVESTALAAKLGDRAWRDLLDQHYQAARAELERYRGREVKTTGDGLLAVFDAPGSALQCAAAIRASARRHDLDIRAGVHVGEVDIAADDVRGVSVHEAARIMAAAEPGEILLSEIAQTLALSGGFRFEARGSRQLKGLSGERRLFAFSGN
jgi:class 3 adenylate cyclase